MLLAEPEPVIVSPSVRWVLTMAAAVALSNLVVSNSVRPGALQPQVAWELKRGQATYFHAFDVLVRGHAVPVTRRVLVAAGR